MAEWENRLGQDSPLARALRLAMPEDMRNPLLHPESVNHFALPPKQPTAELRNPAPRPGDYLSPVSEALSPTMGAYGLGNALGDAYVKGREGDYKGMASPLAEILLSMAPVPGMKKGAMPPRVENPIKAYHGSPHDFDKFDLSKIGTGEGAQAYGHGLYFAENEGVARSYREALKPDKRLNSANDEMMHLRLGDKSLQELGVDPSYSKQIKELVAAGDPNAVRSFLAERQQRWEAMLNDPSYPFRDYAADKVKSYQDVLSHLDAGATIRDNGAGRMYEVAIHATPDQFLDWDKPLSQQSEAVRKAFPPDLHSRTGAELHHELTKMLSENRPKTMEDASFASYRPNVEAQHIQGQITQRLRDEGIPGIRYLDQGSRGAGNGTSNFVVFDPALIEILRKYGLLGPVAAGATANALMGDKSEQ